MQLGLAIGACSVALAWLISEKARRVRSNRADMRFWAAVKKLDVPPQRGSLSNKQDKKLQTVFAQDTTLPQAKTRKRTCKK